MRLLVFILILGLSVSQAGPFCPPMEVIGSPINIVSEYLSTLLNSLDIRNDSSNVGLIDIVSSKKDDVTSHKFFFEIKNTDQNSISYIALEAIFPNDRSQVNRYKISKFIQSSEVADILAVMGVKELPPHATTYCNDFKFSLLKSLVSVERLPSLALYNSYIYLDQIFLDQLKKWIQAQVKLGVTLDPTILRLANPTPIVGATSLVTATTPLVTAATTPILATSPAYQYVEPSYVLVGGYDNAYLNSRRGNDYTIVLSGADNDNASQGTKTVVLNTQTKVNTTTGGVSERRAQEAIDKLLESIKNQETRIVNTTRITTGQPPFGAGVPTYTTVNFTAGTPTTFINTTKTEIIKTLQPPVQTKGPNLILLDSLNRLIKQGGTNTTKTTTTITQPINNNFSFKGNDLTTTLSTRSSLVRPTEFLYAKSFGSNVKPPTLGDGTIFSATPVRFSGPSNMSQQLFDPRVAFRG